MFPKGWFTTVGSKKKTPSKKLRMNSRSTLQEFDEWNKATVTPNLLRQVCWISFLATLWKEATMGFTFIQILTLLSNYDQSTSLSLLLLHDENLRNTGLAGAQPRTNCSFARHLVGKTVIHCSFANLLSTKHNTMQWRLTSCPQTPDLTWLDLWRWMSVGTWEGDILKISESRMLPSEHIYRMTKPNKTMRVFLINCAGFIKVCSMADLNYVHLLLLQLNANVEIRCPRYKLGDYRGKLFTHPAEYMLDLASTSVTHAFSVFLKTHSSAVNTSYPASWA